MTTLAQSLSKGHGARQHLVARLSAQSGTDNENLAVTPHLAKLRLYKSELEQVSGEVRESESVVARRPGEALQQAA